MVVVIAALSWSTLSRVGIGWFSALVAALALGALALSAISWYNTGYHVIGRELRIHEGLLWRRTRAIPLERLQAVEVVRPLLAQLTGLAELRLEVVGGGKTEAPLAYLSVSDAVALRERLIRLAGRVPAADGWAGPGTSGWVGPGATAPEDAVTADVGPPGLTAAPDGAATGPGGAAAGWSPPAVAVPVESLGAPLHAVANRDLLISQLLTPQAFLLPFGLAFVVAQFVSEGSRSFIAVASTLTAMVGVLLQPGRRVLDDWNFRLRRDITVLRVRHGLLETRAQSVPLDRIQAVGVTWPLLWRMKGWLRLRLVVAGYAAGEPDDRNRPDRLLPVGDLVTGRRITGELLPGLDLTALPLAPAPARARWLRPVGQPALGAGLTPTVFAVKSGRLTRQMFVVPFARIQSVRVVQGPVQRRLRLATVYADTAGGSSAVAHHRDLAEAWVLAGDLAAHARTARRTG